MTLAAGQRAPEFSAPDQDGTIHTLSSYTGRWLLLYFYPEDDTPGCIKEACGLRDLFAELTKNVVVVGVSSDSPESHAAFRKKYSLPFDLLADQEKKLIKAYGTDRPIFSKRVSFLIDPQGIIQKVYPNVKPEEHAQEVLIDLRRQS